MTNVNDHSTFFFFNDMATTEIYPLSLHDAPPILSTAANGTLSNLAGGSYNSTTGIYTLNNGTQDPTQAPLPGLIFTPPPLQDHPAQTVTTTFTIAFNDAITTPPQTPPPPLPTIAT